MSVSHATQTDESVSQSIIGDGSVDRAIERIEEQVTAIRDREVESALAQLDARGDLTPEESAAVEGLADRIVERLLADPDRILRGTDGDEEAIERAVELFG